MPSSTQAAIWASRSGSARAAVVSCSRPGRTPEVHSGQPWTEVELRSGDLLVFRDASRLAYHGVPMLLPHSPHDVPDIGLGTGRLNITLRVSGFTDDPTPALQPDEPRRGSAPQTPT